VVDVINEVVGYMREKYGYLCEMRKQNAKLKMNGTGRKSDCRSH
jgi:CTP:phosphocholine cytidylyltransferase-like protein